MKNEKKVLLKESIPAAATNGTPPQETMTDSSPLLANVAIGTMAMYATTLLLWLLNKAILSHYNPDIAPGLKHAYAITIKATDEFFPEPTERLQYQLSLLCLPFFIYLSYTLISRWKAYLLANKGVANCIVIAGLVSLVAYIGMVIPTPILHIPEKTNAVIFANNTISLLTPFVALPAYAVVIFLFFYLKQRMAQGTDNQTKIVSMVCYAIAGLVLIDLFFYNIFHLELQDIGKRMETNASFYAVTQVYAGKSLLVNLNDQYGLYPWFLKPVFGIIGLSTYKYGLVMAILNVLSFLFFFLGIKKLLRNDVLALLVFLATTWWLYWVARIEFEAVTRVYYQFHPIRIIFPSLTFYLLVLYQSGSESSRKKLLPALLLVAASGVLWNMDSGLVSFGATLIALVSATIGKGSLKDTLTASAKYVGYLVGSLLAVLAVFAMATKIQSGSWPNLASISDFQVMFYITGYFMLPMSGMHFWNFLVLMYIVAGIYALAMLKKGQEWDNPVIVYLFILGAGIFSYFQGRSFDINVTWVMYPGIILLGILCNKLIATIPVKISAIKLNVSHFVLLIGFLFIVDGAFSMVYHTPAIHAFAWANANSDDQDKKLELQPRFRFLKSNLHDGDTAIILAQDFESYYYASGNYYNPVPIPGTTEWFLKTEVYTLVDYIRQEKYPIIYDFYNELWLQKDTVVKALAQHYHREKVLEGGGMLLLKPGKPKEVPRLHEDSRTLYYSNINNITQTIKKITLPDTFTIEFYALLDSSRLAPNNLIFGNVENGVPYKGIAMAQFGNSLSQYCFTLGDGQKWAQDLFCIMSCTTENHVVIKVHGSQVAIYNNGQLNSQKTTGMQLVNSIKPFFINVRYAGMVKEMKISTEP